MKHEDADAARAAMSQTQAVWHIVIGQCMDEAWSGAGREVHDSVLTRLRCTSVLAAVLVVCYYCEGCFYAKGARRFHASSSSSAEP